MENKICSIKEPRAYCFYLFHLKIQIILHEKSRIFEGNFIFAKMVVTEVRSRTCQHEGCHFIICMLFLYPLCQGPVRGLYNCPHPEHQIANLTNKGSDQYCQVPEQQSGGLFFTKKTTRRGESRHPQCQLTEVTVVNKEGQSPPELLEPSLHSWCQRRQ